MLNSIIIDVFRKTDIAEINSLKLYDYENSLKNYFSNHNNYKIYQRYFDWFERPIVKKTHNSFLKDYKKWFTDYFFNSK
jgi:hypothetical protein